MDEKPRAKTGRRQSPPANEDRRRVENWTNVQHFQSLNPAKQVIKQLNDFLTKGAYDLEREDATTWVVRSHRKLTPKQLEAFQQPYKPTQATADGPVDNLTAVRTNTISSDLAMRPSRMAPESSQADLAGLTYGASHPVDLNGPKRTATSMTARSLSKTAGFLRKLVGMGNRNRHSAPPFPTSGTSTMGESSYAVNGGNNMRDPGAPWRTTPTPGGALEV